MVLAFLYSGAGAEGRRVRSDVAPWDDPEPLIPKPKPTPPPDLDIVWLDDGSSGRAKKSLEAGWWSGDQPSRADRLDLALVPGLALLPDGHSQRSSISTSSRRRADGRLRPSEEALGHLGVTACLARAGSLSSPSNVHPLSLLALDIVLRMVQGPAHVDDAALEDVAPTPVVVARAREPVTPQTRLDRFLDQKDDGTLIREIQLY